MKLSMNWMGVAIGLMGSVPAWSAVQLANVNQRPITDREMNNALGHLSEGQRTSFLKDRNNRRQVLMALVDQEVLVAEAEKQKLDQSESYREALAQFKRQYLSTQVLEKNLSSRVTEESAKKYYEVNKRRYSTDQVKVQHILLGSEADVEKVYAMTQQPGADFQGIAEKVSLDPQAKFNRGDIGYIQWDSPFVTEFKEAAFSAEKNVVTGPVKSTFGYHLVKVVDRKVGKPLNYSEVELRVKADMRQALTENYVRQLKKSAKIQINDQALEKLY